MSSSRRSAKNGPSGKKAKEKAVPRPSASIVLISPQNKILLLQRVAQSSSFASAHVFPGGNVDEAQDGTVPPASSPARHEDSDIYRLAALRECFEESGILLARRNSGPSSTDAAPAYDPNGCASFLHLDSGVDVDAARKRIHSNEIRFADWVQEQGGIPDMEGLIPFTRWITPANLPKRFTTQMYVYLLPVDDSSPGDAAAGAGGESRAIVATPDGGVEHTAAVFDDASSWLDKASRGEIILYPPQYYLLHLIANFTTSPGPTRLPPSQILNQRKALLAFLAHTPTSTPDSTDPSHPTAVIPWSHKVISPRGITVLEDGRAVLSLDLPGDELKGSDRGGDLDRVVAVRIGKDAVGGMEVLKRAAVLGREGKL